MAEPKKDIQTDAERRAGQRKQFAPRINGTRRFKGKLVTAEYNPDGVK